MNFVTSNQILTFFIYKLLKIWARIDFHEIAVCRNQENFLKSEKFFKVVSQNYRNFY